MKAIRILDKDENPLGFWRNFLMQYPGVAIDETLFIELREELWTVYHATLFSSYRPQWIHRTTLLHFCDESLYTLFMLKFQ